MSELEASEMSMTRERWRSWLRVAVGVAAGTALGLGYSFLSRALGST